MSRQNMANLNVSHIFGAIGFFLNSARKSTCTGVLTHSCCVVAADFVNTVDSKYDRLSASGLVSMHKFPTLMMKRCCLSNSEW